MKQRIYYVLMGVAIGVLVTVVIGMTGKAFAEKQEAKKQSEYEQAHTQQKGDLPLKTLTDRHKGIRDEFYSAEQKINENQSVEKHIKKIEKQIKDYERKVIIKDNKNEIVNGYLTALDDLKEANDNVTTGKKTNKGVIEDIHYNLMKNHREIAEIERDFEEDKS